MTFSNKANLVKGHSFDSIDEETRGAIIGDLGGYGLPATEAINLAKSLYYEHYYIPGEVRVRYSIPDFVLKRDMTKNVQKEVAVKMYRDFRAELDAMCVPLILDEDSIEITGIDVV